MPYFAGPVLAPSAATRHMRVLHSIDSYLPNTQNWIYPQIADVPGVETSVLCKICTNSEEFPRAGRPFFGDTSSAASTKLVERGCRAALRRTKVGKLLTLGRVAMWRPMLLHAHFGTQGWETLWLKRALRVPLITSFYGVDAWAFPSTAPVWRSRYPMLFRDGDLFLVEGSALRKRMIEIGCPWEKIRVCHLGVDVNKSSFVIPDFTEGLKIAMAGRFVEKKGLVDGLVACREAARRGIRLRITIIGDATESDVTGRRIKHDLLALAQSQELRGRVRFTGFLARSEMQAELRGHNILLCPSRHATDGDAEGGMPFVLVEAMAAGMIGVGSSHCDIPELLVNGSTGYLFTEGNVRELVEVLCSISREPIRQAGIAAAGRQHIEKYFDVSRQLTALSNIYRECINSHV